MASCSRTWKQGPLYRSLLIHAVRWGGECGGESMSEREQAKERARERERHVKSRQVGVGNDECACQCHWTNLLANCHQRQLSLHCFIMETHYKTLIYTQGDSEIWPHSLCVLNFTAQGQSGQQWEGAGQTTDVKIEVTLTTLPKQHYHNPITWSPNAQKGEKPS